MKKSESNNSSYSAKIKVVGVGGGGGNAVSRMCNDFSVRGIEFTAINTDAQDLDYCRVKRKIYIGKNLTRGLGTGMNPELGRQAAEETRSEIVESLKGADLVFITAGLGGGTGSGAAPVIAEAARELGALTVAVVTKPFSFEGAQRSRIAQEALIKLKDKVDTLIVVPNDRIFSVIKKDTPVVKAFEFIDDVLRHSVQGIAELIAMPGIVNVDFADVKAIMKDAGSALVGIGIASGQERAGSAVDQAINSPLLETSIDGAKGILFAVSGGKDLRLNEIHDIAKSIGESVDPSAKIIFGAYHDRKLRKGALKVILLATGFNGASVKSSEPSISTLFSSEIALVAKPAMVTKEEIIAKNDNSGTSGRVSEKESREKKKDDDIWDIPTFLRKKK